MKQPFAFLCALLLLAPASLPAAAQEEMDLYSSQTENEQSPNDFESCTFSELSAPDKEQTAEAAAGSMSPSDALQAAKLRYDQAQAQYDLGSTGFFKEMADLGNTDALRAYNLLVHREGRQYADYVKIGDKKSPTHLENMKKAVDEMDMVNEYRQKENQTEGTNLPDLKTNHTMNAISQYQSSYSSTVIGHSMIFNVGENLAWNHQNPFVGWYDSEKETYKNGGDGAVGHYLNIVDISYEVMGYSYSLCTGLPYASMYGQTFSGYSYTDEAMPVSEYQAIFNTYYGRVTTELAESKAAYEALLKIELTDANISVAGLQSSYTWTGQPIAPSVTISVNGKILVKDTDYSLSFRNNISPGTAAVTVTGKGQYTGTHTVTFKIQKRNIAQASVSGIEASYTCTGKTLTPKPVIT